MLLEEFCKCFRIDLFIFFEWLLIRLFLFGCKFLPYSSWCFNKVLLIEIRVLFFYLFNDDCIKSKEGGNRLFRFIWMLLLLFIFSLCLFCCDFFLKLLFFRTFLYLLSRFFLNGWFLNSFRSFSIIFIFAFILTWGILFRLLLFFRSIFVWLSWLLVQDIASDLIDLLEGFKKDLGDLVKLNYA